MSALDDKITDLVSSVESEETVVDSAIAFIKGVPSLLQAAKDAALAAGATQNQLAALTSLKTTLDSKSTALQAALTANTTDTGGGTTTPPSPPNPVPATVAFADANGNPLTGVSMSANGVANIKVKINNGTLDAGSQPEWNVESGDVSLFPASDGLSGDISAAGPGSSVIAVTASVDGNSVTGRLSVSVS